MKKLIIVFIFLISQLLFAQNQQGIELPDFVITGKQSIDIPIAVKKKPELISTLSEDFILPQYSPEELPILISSLPVPVIPSIKSVDELFYGSLIMKAGRYTIPLGELNINQIFDNYLFNTRVWGSNISEYIPNAGYNTSGISMTHEFFLSTMSDFLPGSKIKIYGDYNRDSYKLYGWTNDPTYLREVNNGSVLLSVSSSYSRWINYNFESDGNVYSFSENGLKETNFNSQGTVEFKTGTMIFGASGNYRLQNLTNNISNIANYNFFSAQGYYTIYPLNMFWLSLGINYSNTGYDSKISPFGSLEIKIDQGFTFSAEYKPHFEFFTVKDFLSKNPYVNFGLIDNAYEEYQNDVGAMIKYEYGKLFEASLTGRYSEINNYFYFDDKNQPGKLDLFLVPDAKIYDAKINLIYNSDRFGNLIYEAEFRQAKDDLKNYIPYEPELSTSLAYLYNFSFGLESKIKYNLMYDIYTNTANSNMLQNYHDISISFGYELFKAVKITADFQNIMNRSNFVWKLYQEKPFDILFGFEYRW
jgi:hypothetical protein